MQKTPTSSYSNKLMKAVDKVKTTSTSIQTDLEILSITPVVSLGTQTLRNNTVLMSNNFKPKTEPSSQENLDCDSEMKSIINKKSRMLKQTRRQSDMYSKSYEIKKWSIDNLNSFNDPLIEKKPMAPSYYPSTKLSRAKFYFEKYHKRRSSFNDNPSQTQ